MQWKDNLFLAYNIRSGIRAKTNMLFQRSRMCNHVPRILHASKNTWSLVIIRSYDSALPRGTISPSYRVMEAMLPIRLKADFNMVNANFSTLLGTFGIFKTRRQVTSARTFQSRATAVTFEQCSCQGYGTTLAGTLLPTQFTLDFHIPSSYHMNKYITTLILRISVYIFLNK